MKTLVASTIVALAAVAKIATAQTGSAPFCLQTSTGAKCVYTTMGDCERARGSTSAAQCITRADAQGVTGLGEPSAPSPTVPASPER
jgi:hypothetical protein